MPAPAQPQIRRSTSSRRSGSRQTRRLAAEHRNRLRVAADAITCCRSSPSSADADHDRGGRPLPGGEGPRGSLSPTSINKTITRLAQILEVAVEYELSTATRAKGKRRRVKASQPAPVWLDRAEHIARAAGRGGRARPRGQARIGSTCQRRAILSTLVFAGLRIGELLDLGGATSTSRPAGSRAGVQDGRRRAAGRHASGAPRRADRARRPRAAPPAISCSRRATGSRTVAARPRGCSRRRLSRERAAGEARRGPLPERPTPHKLRHTFASLLVALGVDPGSRDGSARAHGRDVHAAGLPPRDAPRSGVPRRAAGALVGLDSRDGLHVLPGGAEWAAMGSSDGPSVPALTVDSPHRDEKVATSRAF